MVLTGRTDVKPAMDVQSLRNRAVPLQSRLPGQVAEGTQNVTPRAQNQSEIGGQGMATTLRW